MAFATAGFLATRSYARLERAMLGLVCSFTLATLVCSITMQFTEFGISRSDLAAGFAFDFPFEHLALALAVYGYTGVNSGEIAAYTYWCVEKGYPSYVGHDRDDPEWLARARGWTKVLHADVWVALIILTCATLPFYILGAGVLHAIGEQPKGLETITALSNMFTQTLGPWAVWLFGFGAFFILFSTALSAIAAGGRFVPDYLIEMGFFARRDLGRRHAFTRGVHHRRPPAGPPPLPDSPEPGAARDDRGPDRRDASAHPDGRHPVAAGKAHGLAGPSGTRHERRCVGDLRVPGADGAASRAVRGARLNSARAGA